MTGGDFFALAFTLGCTVGPAVGLFILIGYQLARWLDRRGFELTIGLPPADTGGKGDRYEWD